MGFALNAQLVFHPTTLQLYDAIVPGGAAFATTVRDEHLPGGWVLPHLSTLEMEAISYDMSWFDTLTPQQWVAQLGIPQEILDDPFALDDHALAAVLSLAGSPGTVLVSDDTHAGIIIHEYAATYHNGRLLAATGADYILKCGYLYDSGHYQSTLAAVPASPTTFCVERIDKRFAGSFLYDGYLPRSTERPIYQARREGWPPTTNSPIDVAHMIRAWIKR